MEFLRNNTRQVETGTTVVSGSSLSEAFKKVRRQFGEEAVISGSRTRSRRKSNGWGTEQIVEVVVETSGTAVLGSHERLPQSSDLNAEIRYEVERLEKMVEDIIQPATSPDGVEVSATRNPLGEFLVTNGAGAGTVDRLMTRFAGETGLDRGDRPGAMTWLTGYLSAGTGDLSALKGKHAFLCEHETDRLVHVLAIARKLHESGLKVLVLSVLPDPERDVTRLQTMAAETGHDAAILRDPGQIEKLSDNLDIYDSVLLDMPSLNHPAMANLGPLHTWLAANTNFHRHLQVPMDRDFLDLTDLREAARIWNGDCLFLTRTRGTSRPAKLLDLVDAIPLPVSLLADGPNPDGGPESATSERLLDMILAQRVPAAFTPGLEAVTA
jgi:hypothetical protein